MDTENLPSSLPRVVLGKRNHHRISDRVTAWVPRLEDSPLKERDPNAQKSPRPSKKRRKSPPICVGLSKWRLDNEHDPEPRGFPYDNCVCDLSDSDSGGDRLEHAKATGKINHIVFLNGSIVLHLLDCKANTATKIPRYDPATVATDILRAEGAHPHEPALNKHFVEVARERTRRDEDAAHMKLNKELWEMKQAHNKREAALEKHGEACRLWLQKARREQEKMLTLDRKNLMS